MTKQGCAEVGLKLLGARYVAWGLALPFTITSRHFTDLWRGGMNEDAAAPTLGRLCFALLLGCIVAACYLGAGWLFITKPHRVLERFGLGGHKDLPPGEAMPSRYTLLPFCIKLLGVYWFIGCLGSIIWYLLEVPHILAGVPSEYTVLGMHASFWVMLFRLPLSLVLILKAQKIAEFMTVTERRQTTPMAQDTP